MKKQMEKIQKYLMLLLVATLTLTFTSCGGDDDKDEPDQPVTSSFLIGSWTGSEHVSFQGDYSETLNFKNDGTFTLVGNGRYYSNSYNYELRGTWKLKNNNLHLKYSYYTDGTFNFQEERDSEILYDDYTKHLVFLKDAPGNVKQFIK